MFDREFLIWLHQHLLHVGGEDYDVDYMGKLRSIIEATDPEQFTPNTAPDISGDYEM